MKRTCLFLATLLLSALMQATAAGAAERAFKLPELETTGASGSYAQVTQKKLRFENGDFFWVRRYEFSTDAASSHFSTFSIPGNEIEIRYVSDDGNTQEWVATENYDELPKTTLFISTDKHHIILGLPAVYAKQESYNVLERASDQVRPVHIMKGDGVFDIMITFPQDTRYIGELWALQSNGALIEWNEASRLQFMSNEFVNNARISLDGYYYVASPHYVPGGSDILFLHPSCYSGGSFSRSAGSRAGSILGYVLMKLSAANQNELGFYPVPCESKWLRADFDIGSYYYDTRWNSDFLANLVDAYNSYGDPEFMERALKYAEFFVNFAYEYSYPEGDGILVQDYWHKDGGLPTHVALNHQLSELNALLKLYAVNNDDRYRVLAEKLLLGVENTAQEWVLPDGNLRYALYYNGDANVMIDYPTLTYNDLFQTRTLIKTVLNRTSEPIQMLMDSKLLWMNKNGITEYSKQLSKS